jgi:uncharacterized membrane protein
MTALVCAAAIGTALVAGIFFAFSTFVMGALARLEPRGGISAMQAINVVVINPWFMLAFFGAGALSVATVLVSLLGEPAIARAPVVTGALLYLIGCLLVTLAGNVPLNDRLARTDPDGEDAASVWRLYLVRWTRWNHLRTAASLAAAVAFMIAAEST